MMPSTPWFLPELWPDGHVDDWRPHRSATARRRFVALPGNADIQQLLPWRPSTIRAATQRVSDDRTRFSSVRDASGVVALLLLAPFSPRRRFAVRSDSSLADHVAEALGVTTPVFATVLFGPARANRKPVVQLHDGRGQTIAWVKVGTTDLTRALLGEELATLAALADADLPFTVPAVLASGRFGDAEWAALEPISVDQREQPTTELLDEVALSVERTAERSETPLGDSPLIARLRAEADGLEHAAAAVERLVDQHGHRPLVVAASHGDFVPWNMLSGRPKPAVWDWERYDVSTPVGFDRIHRRIQVAVQKRATPLASAAAEAESELRHHSDLPSESWPLHIDCYLTTLLCRYERDAQSHPNPRLLGRISDLASVLTERGTNT